MVIKTSYIINPICGKGRGNKFISSVQNIVTKNEFTDELYITKYKGHARQIASQFDNTSRRVVVFGGDGTFNEVINGLHNNPACSVTIIPIGSGNDFARNVGAIKPKNTFSKIKLFPEKKNYFDIGRINYKELNNNVVKTHYFASSCGIGFDAKVSFLSNKQSFLTGLPLYLTNVFRALITYEPIEVTGSVDTSYINGRKILINFGNTSTSGGGFRLTPEAKIDDGYLDYMGADNLHRVKILSLLPKAIFGKHISHPKVFYKKFQSAKINLKTPSIMHADGEIISEMVTEFEIKCERGKIKYQDAELE